MWAVKEIQLQYPPVLHASVLSALPHTEGTVNIAPELEDHCVKLVVCLASQEVMHASKVLTFTFTCTRSRLDRRELVAHWQLEVDWHQCDVSVNCRGLCCIELLGMCVCVCPCALQGLDTTVLQRIRQLQFTKPCLVRVDLPDDMHPDHAQAGIAAALQQLSTIPAQSTIQLHAPDAGAARMLRPAAAAMAAAAAAHPQWTIRAPKMYLGDAVLTLHSLPGYEVAHASFRDVRLSEWHASRPWPWQSLRLGGLTELEQLLYLPDPTNGQWDIEVKLLLADVEQVSLPLVCTLACTAYRTLHSRVYSIPHYFTGIVVVPSL